MGMQVIKRLRGQTKWWWGRKNIVSRAKLLRTTHQNQPKRGSSEQVHVGQPVLPEVLQDFTRLEK